MTLKSFIVSSRFRPRLLSTIALGFVYVMTGCTQHEIAEDYSKPSILFDSCVVTSDQAFDVYLSVDKGERFNGHRLEISVYDGDNLDQNPIVAQIPLKEDRLQNVKYQVSAPMADHKYLVYATLSTDQNKFVIGPCAVSVPGNSLAYKYGSPYYIQVGEASQSRYLEPGVALSLTRGQEFMLAMDEIVNSAPVTVKIGNRVVTSLWDTTGWGDGTQRLCVDVPEDMPGGIYDVTLEFTNGKIKVGEPIKVLPWKVEHVTVSTTKKVYNREGFMHLGNKLYSLMHSGMVTEVDCYDTKTQTWNEKKSTSLMLTRPLVCDGKGYAIDTNSQQLVQYQEADDSWKAIGTTPTGNHEQLISFVIGDKLYYGGGWHPGKDNVINDQDFYCYDVKTKKWAKLGNLPFDRAMGTGCLECGGEKMGYVMAYGGRLWSYDSGTDTWIRRPMLVSSYDNNLGSGSMIQYQGKLIVVGSENDKSIHVFDPSTNQWELMALYGSYYYQAITFSPAIFIEGDEMWIGPQTTASLYDPSTEFLKVNIANK